MGEHGAFECRPSHARGVSDRSHFFGGIEAPSWGEFPLDGVGACEFGGRLPDWLFLREAPGRSDPGANGGFEVQSEWLSISSGRGHR